MRRVYANWQDSIPSRFLDELPDADVERVGPAAMARQARLAGVASFPGQFPMLARRPRVTDVWEQPARPARNDAVPVGARVFHQKFGYGTVKAAADDRLDIAFDRAGEKRVLDRFVELV